MEIRKEYWSEIFDSVLSGRKSFGVRLVDFPINERGIEKYGFVLMSLVDLENNK